MKSPDELTPMTPAQAEFFVTFYKQYKRYLYYVVRNYTKDPNDIEDIVQDTLLRLMHQVDTLMESEHPGILKYISIAVSWAFKDYCRKKHLDHPQIPWDDNIFDFERTKWDFVSDLDTRRQLEALQKELPRREWLALTGKYYYGYSDTELGDRMGVKPSSVRTLMGRIRKKAQSILLGGSLTGGGGNER